MSERQAFQGFANFLSELGPHPFLPSLMGVVFRHTPLITVIEELENRDLLGFLWRCRQVEPTIYTIYKPLNIQRIGLGLYLACYELVTACLSMLWLAH